ncbi:MAG: LCP family protein [Defluviitaleaceae bacterium]|nr:LCP family protein [Defluviitaleaceae bacterium]
MTISWIGVDFIFSRLRERFFPPKGGNNIDDKETTISKGRRVKQILFIGGAIAGVYLLIAVTVVVAQHQREMNYHRPPSLADDRPVVVVPPIGENDNEQLPTHLEVDENENDNDGSWLQPPARTNFLLIGIDNFVLADAIMVGTFYRDSGEIRLMSIPRDTRAHISQYRLDQMRADGLRPFSPMRINAIRSIGGSEFGVYYLSRVIEDMLGVQFDFYVEVEMLAFRRIVDIIGGVEVYVPRRFFYADAGQNLRIDLQPGLQVLDGGQAEGFVRFRSFPMGDLTRIEMQHEFMQQIIRQTLTREAIMNNPLELLTVIIDHVHTNFSILTDAPAYVRYIGNVDLNGIQSFAIPGFLQGSYFVIDAQNLPGVVNQVFFHTPGAGEDATPTEESVALDDETEEISTVTD